VGQQVVKTRVALSLQKGCPLCWGEALEPGSVLSPASLQGIQELLDCHCGHSSSDHHLLYIESSESNFSWHWE